MNKEEIKVMIKDCVYSEDGITYMSDKHYNNCINIIEQLQQENKQLKENYERTYNENRALREKNYITNTDLIYENYILSQAINKAIEYIENHSLYKEEYDYDYEENIYLSGIDDETAKKDLLEILNEVE